MRGKGARWLTGSSQVGSAHSPPMKSEAGLGGETPEAVPPSGPGPCENLRLDDAVGPPSTAGSLGPGRRVGG